MKNQTTADGLQRAAERLDASELQDGRWAYYDDGMGRYYIVGAADLAELCDYLDSDDETISGDAYSHWCAGTVADEMPRGWTPDNSEVVA